MKRENRYAAMTNLVREFAALRQKNMEQDRLFWERRYQANLDAQRKVREARFEEDAVPGWLAHLA